MTGRALCNACLADIERPTPDANGVMFCPLCEGEACDCRMCMQTLAALHVGVRIPSGLGLLNLEPGFAWTPEKGIAS